MSIFVFQFSYLNWIFERQGKRDISINFVNTYKGLSGAHNKTPKGSLDISALRNNEQV